jgi:N-acetylmuramoyl-L-alanine amidase
MRSTGFQPVTLVTFRELTAAVVKPIGEVMNKFVPALAAILLATGCAKSPAPSPTRTAVTQPSTRAGIVPNEPDGYPTKIDDALAMLDRRADWFDREPLQLTRHPYEQHLKGWVIVLDPGHGGDALVDNGKFKRGPAGVREAEMNLRVARLLKKLLDGAGANVILTRDGDYDLGLVERAEIANNAPRPDGGVGADLFLCIHHNAADGKANYTSVWYHGPVDNAEVELDMARYLALNLARFLRTDIPKTQPIMSDRQMYAGGFGMLRACRVPAVLTESSFYTEPNEEQRLRDSAYNLREAMALYWALCEYARGGRPTVVGAKELRPAKDGSDLVLKLKLDDGLKGGWGAELGRILPSTADVRVDGNSVPHDFDPATATLTVRLPALKLDADGNRSTLSIRFMNAWKHSNYPQDWLLDGDTIGYVFRPGLRQRVTPPPTTGPVHTTRPVGTTRPATPARELLQTTRPSR